jgi:hypothetical protein
MGAVSKTTSLSVHRNTIEQRRKRELAKDATKRVEAIIREKDVRAYAFVAIGSDGMMYAVWDTGKILPMWAFPDTMSAALRRDIEESGVVEDWVPPLPVRS